MKYTDRERFTAYEWYECRDGLRRRTSKGVKAKGGARRILKQKFLKQRPILMSYGYKVRGQVRTKTATKEEQGYVRYLVKDSSVKLID